MNNAGDAAEQIVKMSLEGSEVALRLSGSAAKNIAAAIFTVLKNRDRNKLKGRQRLTAMLKSGKELKVFTIGEAHLKQFATEARRYGVVYCALRGNGRSGDGLVDVLVRAEDAAKINRIVERFRMAEVDATVKADTGKRHAQKKQFALDEKTRQAEETERKASGKASGKEALPEGKLLEEMMGMSEKKEAPVIPNPPVNGREKSPPSEDTLRRPGRGAGNTIKEHNKRPSVRKKLQEIQAARQNVSEQSRSKHQERTGGKSRQKIGQHNQSTHNYKRRNRKGGRTHE